MREEDGQRVDAPVEEDRDEHRVRRARGERLGDSVVEGAWRERRRAVDGDREPDRARDEAPAVEARAGGQRHPRLDVGQPGSGLRDGLAQEGGT